MAPDLGYDGGTGRLTVVTPFSSGHEVRPALWGAVRTESETRCYALDFRRDTGGWRVEVTARPSADCTRRQPVTDAAQAAQAAPRTLAQPDAARSEVQRLLASAASTADGRAYDVATVTDLVHAAGQQQCYRFTRNTDSHDTAPATALPVAAAHCAA
ncbi:hypothetical protein ACIQVK_15830 [Streptomyces sp. NPDC090493]|uniref:hypothetical protein n=1 Tax=Streptomyces sp. NPDC090493 TaxID=3365964 RepID=UPI0037F7797D